ncbi:hypothetical protein [Streptomyces sp. NPDC006477]|uniref:hypothetical protein n=1 Tax=Streptomyces sp. NPDC006477 TaxID=3364747 RepID=UPI0036B0412C
MSRHVRPWLRHYAAQQILADLERWRADRRMREARKSLDTCQTLWQLPARQPARKENGQ